DSEPGVAALARGERDEYRSATVEYGLRQQWPGGQIHVADVAADGHDGARFHVTVLLSWSTICAQRRDGIVGGSEQFDGRFVPALGHADEDAVRHHQLRDPRRHRPGSKRRLPND